MKREGNFGEELLLEKAHQMHRRSPDPFEEDKHELEKEFDALYDKITTNNNLVLDKWKRLSKFQYNNLKDLDLLEVISEEKSTSGETYYGFWYRQFIIV